MLWIWESVAKQVNNIDSLISRIALYVSGTKIWARGVSYCQSFTTATTESEFHIQNYNNIILNIHKQSTEPLESATAPEPCPEIDAWSILIARILIVRGTRYKNVYSLIGDRGYVRIIKRGCAVLCKGPARERERLQGRGWRKAAGVASV